MGSHSLEGSLETRAQRQAVQRVSAGHQHTREVAQRETERIFGQERLRDREFGRHVGLDPKEEHQLPPERDWQPSFLGPGMDRDSHGRC